MSANFFPNLKTQDVQKIFNDADKSKIAVYLVNSSNSPIPAVQILPETEHPKYAISSGTQCIKLYSCNQDICLIGIKGKKFATNGSQLRKFTQEYAPSNQCVASNNAQKSVNVPKQINSPTSSWVQVTKVETNDSLNIRQKTHHKSKKMGSIEASAKCLKRFNCKGKWCKVEYQSITGWVHKKYITPMDSNNLKQCL
jgi:hypothetical protein